MKLGAVTDFERPGGRFAATPAGILAATPGGMLPTPVPQPLGHKSTDQYCLLIIIENGNNNSSNSKIYYVISYHIISDHIISCHVISYIYDIYHIISTIKLYCIKCHIIYVMLSLFPPITFQTQPKRN